jgi:hypothetical protein
MQSLGEKFLKTNQIKSLKLLESDSAKIKEVALLLAFECGGARPRACRNEDETRWLRD